MKHYQQLVGVFTGKLFHNILQMNTNGFRTYPFAPDLMACIILTALLSAEKTRIATFGHTARIAAMQLLPLIVAVSRMTISGCKLSIIARPPCAPQAFADLADIADLMENR